MTVVTFASIKGAPGVTTLACLVGATWPGDRRVMVAECDPSGGDLSARFGLSSKRGWPTFATAVRRSGMRVGIEPHLQKLPGGLDVLVGPGVADDPDGVRAGDELAANLCDEPAGAWDILVDVGRLPGGDLSSSGWLARSDGVVILLRGDATSVLHVRNRVRDIRNICGDRAALVVVGRAGYGNGEIAEFTGIRVVGNVPFDPVAAAVAAGGQGSERRLSRSLLTHSALRLSESLCGAAPDAACTDDAASSGWSAGGPQSEAASTVVGHSTSPLRRYLDRSARRFGPRSGGSPAVMVPGHPLEEELHPENQREVSA